MDTEDKEQNGYYQTIAREFLARRGAPFFLSPRDQSAIASWESRQVPLQVVIEGIGRAFEGFKTRGRGTKGVSLAFCDRQVDAAMGQHLDRMAGRRNAAGPRPGKKDRARREVEKGLRGLAPDDREIARLLEAALAVLAAPKSDEAALERIDAEVEELLWARATEPEKSAAEAEVRKRHRGRPPGGLDAMVRRQVVKESRHSRKIPHVSLYYY
jgi:hypothetical protein